MSIENVREYFSQFNLDNRVVEHSDIGDTVTHAAQILGCEEKQIVKSMTFIIHEKPVLVALAGDAKVDNKKFKNEFQSRPKMIPFEEVEKLVGHVPGAVTPFAVNKDVRVYLDVSLKRFNTVYTAGGSLNSTIMLSIDELEKYASPVDWVDVAKGWIINE
ncbi:YbaK/EbsC family protein [Leuconostoc falkenbergense]|uniref:YbaK/EbsC family protein n=1 Tax=Leuconostoc falkenbergense TaxID=2766470 RepID=UPI0024ADF8F9|nr:YbaK/EbsC family protein [Leuconostoc falkenbergense]MDI6666749.1 YbaK/EbsC family protein [Leuconostoc falkenbergense]